MSRITNLMLTFSIVEHAEKRMEEVNAFEGCILNLVSIDYNKDPEQRTKWYGGSKFWIGHAYFGAINYLPVQRFVEHLRSIAWRERESVQLIIMEEDERLYQVINVFGNHDL